MVTVLPTINSPLAGEMLKVAPAALAPLGNTPTATNKNIPQTATIFLKRELMSCVSTCIAARFVFRHRQTMYLVHSLF